MVSKRSAGFRIDSALYEELSNMAEAEQRSIASILCMMVEKCLRDYKRLGFKALLRKDEI